MITLVLAGLAGLAAGSFLCLAADRFQPNFTSRQWLSSLALPASHCSTCRHRLKISDLIPIYSWCRLQGKCRYCQSKLPPRLLIVEALTALLFGLQASCQPSPFPLIFSLPFSAALILLSLIDWRHLLLPDVVTLPLLWLGLLYHVTLYQERLSSAVIGALLGWLFLWGLYWGFRTLCNQEGIGYGDMKLFAALGAWCGWQALPSIALMASLLGLTLFAWRGLDQGAAGGYRRQPFGPCLSVAGWAIVFGQMQTGNVTFLL